MKKHGISVPDGMFLGRIAVVLIAACGMICGISAAEPLQQGPSDPRAQAEAANREKLLKTIDPMLNEAMKLLEKRKYREAREKCDQAQKKLDSMNLGSGPNVLAEKSMILQLRQEIVQQWGQYLYADIARNVDLAYRTGNKDPKQTFSYIQRAENQLLVLIREVPGYRKQTEAMRKKIAKIKSSMAFENEISLKNLDPDNAKRKEKIAISLRHAEVCYKKSLYSKARDILEQILVEDPYNEKAISMLRRIYRKLYSVASVRKENEILDAMNQLDWNWANQVLPRGDAGLEDKGPVSIDGDDNAKIYEKLRTIIIPEVDFSNVEVQNVINQLNQLSKENDPDKKGVDFASSLDASAKQQTVSMILEKIPLSTLLDYLCLVTGLKYSVTNKGVLIGNLDSMIDYTTKMRITTYNNISHGYSGGAVKTTQPAMEIASSSAGGSEGGTSLGVGVSSSGGKEQTIVGASNKQLQDYFEKSGVPFPPGASVTFHQESGTLTARNTRENLDKLKAVLAESEAVSQMILIESKFLEISAKDLEELGFEWTLTHNNTNPRWMTGVNSDPDMATTVPSGDAAISQGLLRFFEASSESTVTTSTSSQADMLINNLNVLPNFGPSGAYNVFLTVHAIDQTSRGETLAAPKVIATASMPAVIQLTEEYYFPQSWSEAEVTSNNNSFQYKPSIPTLGKGDYIGIILKVTPYLSTNGQTITLQLNPSITSHDDQNDWDHYDYQIVVGNIKSYDATLKMPVINERSVDTQLKIYDGETIAIGGIMEDKIYQIDDRYPFLGDLPLLGRFFSTQMKQEVKTNLLIFVSARILKLDGLPKTQKDDNGLFYFNR